MEQFGFRPGHSTELAAIRLVDYLMSEMDSNNTPLNTQETIEALGGMDIMPKHSDLC